jgi:predicted permease
VTIALLFFLRMAAGPMDHSFMMAMLLATGVSTAGSAPALAQRYGLDAEHTAALTIGTTVISVLTVPVMSLLLESIL